MADTTTYTIHPDLPRPTFDPAMDILVEVSGGVANVTHVPPDSPRVVIVDWDCEESSDDDIRHCLSYQDGAPSYFTVGVSAALQPITLGLVDAINAPPRTMREWWEEEGA